MADSPGHKDMEIAYGFVRNLDLVLTHEYIGEENHSENDSENKLRKRKEYILILMMRMRKYIFLRKFKSLCSRITKQVMCIIIAESIDVNSAKMNPIKASKFILDSVEPVKKVINIPSGLKISCYKKTSKYIAENEPV